MCGRVICQASGFVHMIEKQRRGLHFENESREDSGP